MAGRGQSSERDFKVLELRRAGVTFDEIAHRLQFANKGSACKAYHRALERAESIDRGDLSGTVRLELDRLERLQAGLWTKASRGDLGAVDRVLAISKRRAQLLGLDVAKGRVSVSAQSSADHDRDEPGEVIGEDRVRQMRERRARDAAERAAGS